MVDVNLVAPPAKITKGCFGDGAWIEFVVMPPPPFAPGPLCVDGFVDASGPGWTWGNSMTDHAEWPYLVGLDGGLR